MAQKLLNKNYYLIKQNIKNKYLREKLSIKNCYNF